MPDSAFPIPQGEDLFSQVEAKVRELQPVNRLHEMALTIHLALRRLVFPLPVVNRARLQGELWRLVDDTRSRVEVGFPTWGEKKQTDLLTQRLRTLLDTTTNALEVPDGRRAFENLLCEWRKVAEDIEGGLCTKPSSPEGEIKPRRRGSKRQRRAAQKPLTKLQTQAVELYGTHNGKVTEIAREMGIKYQAVQKHLKAAWRKLPELTPKSHKSTGRTKRLPRDRRGQVAL